MRGPRVGGPGREGRGLVNNAGGQYRAPLSTITTKGFDAVARTHLTGGFIVMREVYNRWMAEDGGSIVNMIADIWNGWPHASDSAAARGGMLTLTESAATEWASSGGRVIEINPTSPTGVREIEAVSDTPVCSRVID